MSLPNSQPIAVSPGKAAEMLGISTSTFYKEIMPFVYGGTIASTKIGRRRIILVESLYAWLRERAKTEGG